ncbi:helix-turn-helix domain-containing protein [Roseomonas sp. OT10]|uniref:MerR family transcriptional regulator n=1 Tax=Roseomonas cutis TaxID=2897332 RepID=UPI001E36A0DF|nr:helix-turn-helix domain-containing protein [Roseomonas sp. OT10]UFN48981.1 helix-turn-helix domain-containing protein [Roseomonas sp. OT10]
MPDHATPSDPLPRPVQGRLSIGDLATAVGVNVRTIRYYEAAGLLPEPARTAGNQRSYGPAHLHRLAFVRHAREMGFDMAAIRDLLRLADAGAESPCAGAHAVARQQLAATRSRIARLRSLEAELERMLDGDCDGGQVGHCRIVEALADHAHGHCLDPSHGGPEAA